jgi:hypothetical protein
MVSTSRTHLDPICPFGHGRNDAPAAIITEADFIIGRNIECSSYRNSLQTLPGERSLML